MPMKTKKLSLEELEAILNGDENTPVLILPNGDICEIEPGNEPKDKPTVDKKSLRQQLEALAEKWESDKRCTWTASAKRDCAAELRALLK